MRFGRLKVWFGTKAAKIGDFGLGWKFEMGGGNGDQCSEKHLKSILRCKTKVYP